MEKNMVWAVVLSAVVLMVWYRFFPPVPAPKTPASQTASQSSGEGGKPESAVKPFQEVPQAQPPKPEPEKEKTVETSDMKIVFHSRGAGIKHWWLKDKEGLVDLVNHGAEGAGALSGELPLSTFPELNFAEAQTADPGQSFWKATLPGGARVEKKYFPSKPEGPSEEGAHFWTLALTFSNPGKSAVQVPEFALGWNGGLGTVASEQKENKEVTRLLAYPSPSREVAVFKEGSHLQQYRWVGMDNRYYLAAFLPEQGQFGHILTRKSKSVPAEVKLATEGFALAPGESRAFELKVYGGPKGYTHLKKYGLGLEHAVDFGYFGFLGKWALKAMYSLTDLTGNYGWAIILLTCFLQIIVFPLSLKSYKSMAAMKKLQPKIQELQKRYKDDPKQMNQQMLNLYKEAKTNPFGGCLPMLMQIPIFWAFFTMLRNSYELKGAPWILWIRDLSKHDPYFVLPIVMGGGMFLQQKISGTTADPTQAQIMMFMPILFTFMFLKFPSGLVLYWLTNSILSIAMQFWFTRKYAKA